MKGRKSGCKSTIKHGQNDIHDQIVDKVAEN